MANLLLSGQAAGAVQMLGATLAFTCLDTIVKLAGGTLTIWQIGLGRYIIGGLVVLLLARMAGLSVWGRSRKLLLLRGVAGTTSFLFMILALTELELSLTLALFFLFPAFSALFAPWVTGELPQKWEWPLIALAFGGALIILSPSGVGQGPGLGHLYAIIGAASAGLSAALIRRLRSNNNALTLYFYYCLVGCLISLIAATTEGSAMLPAQMKGWGLWLVIGLTAMVGQLLMNMGFKHLPAHVGGVVLMSEVILGALVGVLLLGEDLGWRMVLGSVFILASSVIMSLSPAAKRRRACAPRP